MPAEILGSLLGQASAAQVANMQQNKNFHDNIMLWRMQQDYNLPVNQVARLREAKLSPHTIYGHSAPVNTASQAPQPVDYATAHKYSQQGIDVMMALMQIEKMKAEIKNIDAQTQLTGVNTGIQEIEQQFRAKTLHLGQQQQQEGINLLKLQQDQTAALTQTEQARLDQVIATTAGLLQENEYRAKYNPISLQQATKNVLKTIADTKLAQAQASKVPSEKKVLEAQAYQLNRSAQSIEYDIELKNFSYQLSRIGLTPQDPVYVRLVLGQSMKSGRLSGQDIKDALMGKDGMGTIPKLRGLYNMYKSLKTK